MPDKRFLSLLSQKLKTGNLRSIHLNALTGRYATRLDLFSLKQVRDDALSDFITLLTHESKFKYNINYDGINLSNLEGKKLESLNLIAKRLNAIYNQNTDDYLEHGVKTFAFGYPLLIKRDKKDPSKIIKAPLLIWYLDIERSLRKESSWTITKDEELPVTINEILIHHLESTDKITLNRLSEDFLSDGIIDQSEIKSICKDVLSQFNINIENDLTLKVSRAPDREKVENLTGSQPWICWAGIFGLFRTQKESIISDIDELIDNYDTYEFDSFKFKPFQKSHISSVETDPSQQQIIESLDASKIKIIQGPPGTGKSQSITAIITNALESGAKCLVVCEKKTALDVIFNNLKNIGLEMFCVVIDDVSRDRKKLIDKVRHEIKTGFEYYTAFRAFDYRNDSKKCQQTITSINLKYKNTTKTVFGDDRWKDLIGKKLRFSRTSNFDILNKLDLTKFKFDYDEYRRFINVVQDGSDLFARIYQHGLPMSLLNDSVFIDEFRQSFYNEFYMFIELLSAKCDNLVRIIEKNSLDHGENFNSWTVFNKSRVWLMSMVTPFYNTIRLKWLTIIKCYAEISEQLDSQNWLMYKSHDINSINNLTILKDYLVAIQTGLSYLIEIKQDFREYFLWHRFYWKLKENEQDVIAPLFEVNPTDWTDVFSGWYIHHVLHKVEESYGPFLEDTRDLENINKLMINLRDRQKLKIIKEWQSKRLSAVDKFNLRGNINRLYNYRKNKQYVKRNSLRRIIHEDLNLFTTLFPVILTNPVACSSIFPLKEGIFDIVFFDEASQLRLEDTYCALIRGKYKIISGDKHQMPPSNYFQADVSFYEESDEEGEESIDKEENTFLADSESLLQYADGLNPQITRTSYLDFHYRSKHPYLIDFSNAAFYGKRLIPMPAQKIYNPIRFFQVDGLYKNRTNEDEADKIIQILEDEIKKHSVGKMPSIGVATMNIDQRNLVNDKITQKCILDFEFEQKFQMLLEKGFFVKNLENIQGDERDIIIISTTFGLNEDGFFRQNFGPINRALGYRLLNVIITRAKEKLYLCTSIPKEYYSRYLDEIPTKGNTGKAIFYAYLAYAEAVELEDEETRKNILDFLLEYSIDQFADQQGYKFVESPFEEEVYEYLKRHIETLRIKPQYEFGGFRIDFVILNKELTKPLVALECDGAAYHSSDQAYAHDLFRQRQLEKYGFKFYRIWSTNWWRNPGKETTLLLKFIEEKEGQKNN